MPAKPATKISAKKTNSPKTSTCRVRRCALAAAGGLLFAWAPVSAAVSDARDLITHGEYVFRISGCGNCHTDTEREGEFLAGGYALETPFGTFYTPNITADREHGIGGWSEEDFVRAMKAGVAPDGRDYFPAFPYTSYTRLSREDLIALKAYLFSVPPSATPNRRHDLVPGLRWTLWLWKLLFFDVPALDAPRDADPDDWRRGAYLARAAAHCGECHTPRNRLGAMIERLYLAGTRNGPEGKSVPNITPDRKTGIGGWDHDDLIFYFETGGTPDGDYAGGLMAEVIDESLVHLTPADRSALATYISSIPAIERRIAKPDRKRKQRDEFEY